MIKTSIFIEKSASNAFRVTITTGGVFQNFITPVQTITPEYNLKVKGNSSNLEIYYNDVLILNEAVTINQDITGAQAFPLYFSAYELAPLFLIYTNSTINSIKINAHEWAFTNWTAPTTTNSQGVETTLHSDVSTSAMIIQTN